MQNKFNNVILNRSVAASGDDNTVVFDFEGVGTARFGVLIVYPSAAAGFTLRLVPGMGDRKSVV